MRLGLYSKGKTLPQSENNLLFKRELLLLVHLHPAAHGKHESGQYAWGLKPRSTARLKGS
jgi:hypothetical protein